MEPENVTRTINNKKLILPMAVAITTLIVLSLSATYAYIRVQTTNKFGTPVITGTVPSVGSVTMNSGASLSLSASRPQMMANNPATYYATLSGMSTSESNMQTIATTTVIGEGTFTCNYTLNIKGTGYLLQNSYQLGEDLVTLEVTNGTNGGEIKKYDFNNDLSGSILSAGGTNIYGTLTDLTSSYSRSIQARFKLTNSASQDQSSLNNKSGTITFTITSFSCTATA